MGELFHYPRIGSIEMSRVDIDTTNQDRYLLRQGDLLFARRSLKVEGAGQCSILWEIKEPTTWESSIIRARLNPSLADPRFYFYFFRSPTGRAAVEAITEQVAAAGIRSSDLANLCVPSPPLQYQAVVADLLRALDDRIEINAQIVGTILDLADSALHDLKATNDHWYRTRFGEVADVFGGGTPSTSEPAFWSGDIAWATPTDVSRLPAPYLFDTARHITRLGLANTSSQLYSPGSIFMTSRATIGAFAIAQRPTAVNQGFIVVVPRHDVERWWLFHEMRSRVDEMIGLANGSTFLEISRKNFMNMEIQMPPPSLLDRFHTLAGPLHQRARVAAQESRVLALLRDALLPKLISGELRIREAERVVEEAV